MSRKDYIVIAKAVNEFIRASNPPARETKTLFDILSKHFVSDNPRFDSDKFERVAGYGV